MEQFAKKIIEIFKGFPDAPFSEVILDQLKQSKEGFTLYYSYIDTEANLSLDVYPIGILRKQIEYATDKREALYKFSYSFYNTESFGTSRRFYKYMSDILCERLLPFMLSQGTDKSTIPLIINDFPEFANSALRYES